MATGGKRYKPRCDLVKFAGKSLEKGGAFRYGKSFEAHFACRAAARMDEFGLDVVIVNQAQTGSIYGHYEDRKSGEAVESFRFADHGTYGSKQVSRLTDETKRVKRALQRRK